MKANVRKNNERGLSMLEYAAAAAVLIGVVYLGFNSFGGSLSSFFSSLGTWANNHSV